MVLQNNMYPNEFMVDPVNFATFFTLKPSFWQLFCEISHFQVFVILSKVINVAMKTNISVKFR